jgi:glycosyltransferase involved in cell wall biosynthesis
MNLLFVLYHDLSCNSASHVDGVARELCLHGDDCTVAVPHVGASGDRFGACPYRVTSFDAVLREETLFVDGRGPDLVHFWTPREVNRRFHARLSGLYSYQTIIHLEDNEEHVARCILGPRAYALAEKGRLPGDFPNGLSCPVRSREFMAEARGFSLLIDALESKVPVGAPRVVFWPAPDGRVFFPRPRNDGLRAQLGIAANDWVLVYHGNTHRANFHEVRSLYLAVALLNRRGLAAKLVRIGSCSLKHPSHYQEWISTFSIDLGHVVNRARVADILAMADCYVQPGTSDPFNDYRFPSKVPEFFAMGRPVILPRANVGRVTRHLEDAYVLDEANGVGICEAVARLAGDAALCEKLAWGAGRFAARNFSWARSAEALRRFYASLSEGPLASGTAAAA